MALASYKDLTVWQKSMDLVVAVYELTSHYPADERFGLISQSRRSAISIPSNIAEGYRRNSRKDYGKFISYAFASAAELETQVALAERLGFTKEREISFEHVQSLLEEVLKMLNSLSRSLEMGPYPLHPTAYSL